MRHGKKRDADSFATAFRWSRPSKPARSLATPARMTRRTRSIDVAAVTKTDIATARRKTCRLWRSLLWSCFTTHNDLRLSVLHSVSLCARPPFPLTMTFHSRRALHRLPNRPRGRGGTIIPLARIGLGPGAAHRKRGPSTSIRGGDAAKDPATYSRQILRARRRLAAGRRAAPAARPPIRQRRRSTDAAEQQAAARHAAGANRGGDEQPARQAQPRAPRARARRDGLRRRRRRDGASALRPRHARRGDAHPGGRRGGGGRRAPATAAATTATRRRVHRAALEVGEAAEPARRAEKAAEAQRRRAEAAAAQLESDELRRKTVREAAERMADGGINPLWMRAAAAAAGASAAKANSAVAARGGVGRESPRIGPPSARIHSTGPRRRRARRAPARRRARANRELKHDFQ